MSDTETEDITAETVEYYTQRAGVMTRGVDFEIVVRAIRDEEIQLDELTRHILVKLGKEEGGVDTRQYVGAVHQWRQLTKKIKQCNDEIEEFS